MQNVNTGTISVDDMLKLKGLKDAWEYVLNTIDDALTMDYILQENIGIKEQVLLEHLGGQNFQVNVIMIQS